MQPRGCEDKFQMSTHIVAGKQGHDSLQELLQLGVVNLPSHAVQHGSTELPYCAIHLTAVQQRIVQHLFKLAATRGQVLIRLIDLCVHLVGLLELHSLVMYLSAKS